MDTTFRDLLEYKIFSFKGDKYNLYVYEVITIILVLFVSFLIDRIAKKYIYKSSKFGPGEKYAIYQIIHYILVSMTFFVMMRRLGIDTSSLILGSSAILVGIGLGLQNLFLDFISGVIILIERKVRISDIIDVDGTVGKVIQINMRTTTVLTSDNKCLYFPNSYLTKNKLMNFSQNEGYVVFNIDVGVHYETDLALAKELMKEAARENQNTLTSQPPFVRLENFGEKMVELKLFFFSENLFRSAQTKSEIRCAIFDKFRQNNIQLFS